MRTSHAVMIVAVAIAACGPDRAPSDQGERNAPPVTETRVQSGELHLDGTLAEGDFLMPTGSLGDRHELDVTEGDLVEVVLQSTAFDSYLEVVTPSGETLVNDDFSGAENQSRLSIPIRSTGKLKVVVSAYGSDGRGAYRLDITRRENAAPAVASTAPHPLGEALAGFLPNARRITEGVLATRGHHHFVLPSDPSQPATPGTPPAIPPGPGGPAPGTPSPAPALPPATPQPGVPAPSTPGNVGSNIQLGSQIQGALEQGDGTLATGELRDLYTFSAQAGIPVNVELQSTDFDPYLILVSPSGQQWENDDANGTLNSQVLMTLSETGTYRIVATSYRAGQSGSYLLKLRTGTSSADAVPAPAGPQPPSPTQTLNGALAAGDEQMSSGEYLDRHRVEWPAGQSLQIRLDSNNFDTYLVVRAPSGRQWDNDDFQQGSLNSGLDLVTPEAGQYTIAVTSFRAGETGTYTVVITSVSGAAPPVPGTPGALPGQPGMPTTPQPMPGAPQPLPPQPGMPQPTPGMPMPGQPAVPGMPMPGQPAVPGMPIPGQPAVPGMPGMPGMPQPAPGVGAGLPIQGTLAQGDNQLSTGEFMDTHPIQLQAGQTVSFRLSSTQFDSYLIVRAPSGRQWDNDDVQPGNLNSGLELTVTEAGQYRVIVTSYRAGETGAYTLAITQGVMATPGMPGQPVPGQPGTPGMPTPGQPAMPGIPGAVPPPYPGMPGTPQPAPGAPRVQPGGGQVFGIYVGITDYPSGRLPLCAEDAIKLAQDMRRAGLQPQENQIVLTDRNATPDRVRQAFANIGRRIGPNDLFIFFYSGHGAQSAVVGTSNELDRREESINLVGGDITDNEMAQLFDQIRARVSIIALDSCFAGGFARDVISRPNRMGFFSSEEDLTSNVASNFQAGGYLSHFLRLGLRGEADNNPRDSLLTAGELAHYLYSMYGTHMQDVQATTTDQNRSYQHLVIDRGSVRVNTPLVSYR